MTTQQTTPHHIGQWITIHTHPDLEHQREPHLQNTPQHALLLNTTTNQWGEPAAEIFIPETSEHTTIALQHTTPTNIPAYNPHNYQPQGQPQ